MVSDLEIRTLSAQPVLLIRTHSPVQHLGRVLGPSFAAILEYLKELGEAPAGPSFAVYYNNDMANLDVGIGFPVSKVLPGKDDIQAGEIPAVQYASCLFTGPHSHLSEAYDALNLFLKGQKLETTGVAYELYLSDAASTSPAELKTIVMLPLENA